VRPQDYLLVEGRVRVEIENMASILDRLQNLGLYPRVCTDMVGGFPITDENAARLVGSYMQDFYNCFENIAKVVARAVDGVGVPEGPEWHAELLRQMNTSIRGVRPEVISDETWRLMDEYSRFRHVFRNVYGFVLDASRTFELLKKLPDAVACLKRDLQSFLTELATAVGIDSPSC